MSDTKTLLNQTRVLTRTVQSQASGHIRFADLVRALGESLGARVGIISRKGKVLAVTEGAAVETGALLDETLNRYLLGIEETTSAQGVGLSGLIDDQPFAVHVEDLIILPIYGGGDRLGTLLVNRILDDEGLVLAEYATSVVGLELLAKHQEEASEESHLHASALMAAKTLSYSETEVLSQVFADLGGTEGLVVASKIADRSGITRSVIVNGLRKLESAGVIVSRSLGMKGTHIKVLNPLFLTELRKLA